MCTNRLHYIGNALNCPLSGKQRILSPCTEGNVALLERKWYRKRERAVESTVEKSVAAPRSLLLQYCVGVCAFSSFCTAAFLRGEFVTLVLI